MSTATVDTPKPSKSTAPRMDRTRLQIHATGDATEQAVSHFVRASYGTLRSMVPPVVARPTETVTLVFDLLEQLVGAGRQLSLEVAQIFEAGLDEIDRVERSEQRAA